MNEQRCNLCDSTVFEELELRGKVRCSRCGSLERTRVAGLLLDAKVRPLAGARILHFAPERGLADKLRRLEGVVYTAVDIAPEHYEWLDVEAFDLCRDLFSLRPNNYDLIVHNHVLEHIECNFSVVLIRLLRALKPTGTMLFSVPIVDDCFSDTLIGGPPAQKLARFGTALHVRQFGRDFLAQTLGMIFDLPATYDLTATIAPDVLRRANVAQRHWHKWTGSSVFCVNPGALRV